MVSKGYSCSCGPVFNLSWCFVTPEFDVSFFYNPYYFLFQRGEFNSLFSRTTNPTRMVHQLQSVSFQSTGDIHSSIWSGVHLPCECPATSFADDSQVSCARFLRLNLAVLSETTAGECGQIPQYLVKFSIL